MDQPCTPVTDRGDAAGHLVADDAGWIDAAVHDAVIDVQIRAADSGVRHLDLNLARFGRLDLAFGVDDRTGAGIESCWSGHERPFSVANLECGASETPRGGLRSAGRPGSRGSQGGVLRAPAGPADVVNWPHDLLTAASSSLSSSSFSHATFLRMLSGPADPTIVATIMVTTQVVRQGAGWFSGAPG